MFMAYGAVNNKCDAQTTRTMGREIDGWRDWQWTRIEKLHYARRSMQRTLWTHQIMANNDRRRSIRSTLANQTNSQSSKSIISNALNAPPHSGRCRCMRGNKSFHQPKGPNVQMLAKHAQMGASSAAAMETMAKFSIQTFFSRPFPRKTNYAKRLIQCKV